MTLITSKWLQVGRLPLCTKAHTCVIYFRKISIKTIYQKVLSLKWLTLVLIDARLLCVYLYAHIFIYEYFTCVLIIYSIFKKSSLDASSSSACLLWWSQCTFGGIRILWLYSPITHKHIPVRTCGLYAPSIFMDCIGGFVICTTSLCKCWDTLLF